jgi:hypothetical protein
MPSSGRGGGGAGRRGHPAPVRNDWRRGRDSNPGQSFWPCNRLAGGCLRPTRPPLQRGSLRSIPAPAATTPATQWAAMKSRTARLNASAWSMLVAWPESGTTSKRAPGISRSRRRLADSRPPDELGLPRPRKHIARDVGGDDAHRRHRQEPRPAEHPGRAAYSGRGSAREGVDQRERTHLRGRSDRQGQAHAAAQREADHVHRRLRERAEQQHGSPARWAGRARIALELVVNVDLAHSYGGHGTMAPGCEAAVGRS